MASKCKLSKPLKTLLIINKLNKSGSLLNYKVFQDIVCKHLCLLDGSKRQVKNFNRSILKYVIQIMKASSGRQKLNINQISHKRQSHILWYFQQQSFHLSNNCLQQTLRHKSVDKLLKQNQLKPLALVARSSQKSKSNLLNSTRCIDRTNNKRASLMRLAYSRRHLNCKCLYSNFFWLLKCYLHFKKI